MKEYRIDIESESFVVEDPVIAYRAIPRKYTQLVVILGGANAFDQEVSSEMDLISIYAISCWPLIISKLKPLALIG